MMSKVFPMAIQILDVYNFNNINGSQPKRDINNGQVSVWNDSFTEFIEYYSIITTIMTF